MTDLYTPAKAARESAIELAGAVLTDAPKGSWALLTSPAWRQFQDDGLVPDFPDTDRLLVSLPLWRARRAELLENPASVALLLDENDDPGIVAADLHRFPLVVLASATAEMRRPHAWSLRHRFGYQGAIAPLDTIRAEPLYP